MKLDPSMLGVSEHERREYDFYPTPATATLAVFETLRGKSLATSTLWEPACGDGAMSVQLAPYFNKIINTDIQPKMDGAVQADFYSYEPAEDFQYIITNPPYGKEADKFIERILYFVETKKCYGAILARNELDSAKGRAKYFRDCPHFMEKRVLLWRPRWIAGSTGAPRHNYAWFYWGPNLYDATITYSHERKAIAS